MTPAIVAALAAACSPLGLDRGELDELRAAEFALPAAAEEDRFLEDAVVCAGDRDPFFRDKIGYEGIAAILRRGGGSEKAVRTQTLAILDLIALPNEAVDPRYGKKRGGFRASFLPLYASEFLRRDRVGSFLNEEELARAARLAAEEIEGVRDFRGFDEEEGWRHHVAHASDLALQLVLNPGLQRAEHVALQAALLSQVHPGGEVFYRYGEPGRLARALLYSVFAEEWEEGYLESLFSPLVDNESFWADAYASQEGLARVHNTRSFLQTVMVLIDGQTDPRLVTLRDAAKEALRQIP
ncbi:DUF2785 domain-containing protein [Parvularcula sp. ZS-1/3]|uniref:DUF2785 domain-containing protein n=1 Tax=Parvularcula mediterranea TaxID=2732508 RepID=A0A7Y3RJ33_9PROT|nr:DUF2785 domain-containing protein [Parvularcula mediterranea]NNU14972.1 DUF2785 domain-containing protein [Parvularcula mediterranea]